MIKEIAECPLCGGELSFTQFEAGWELERTDKGYHMVEDESTSVAYCLEENCNLVATGAELLGITDDIEPYFLLKFEYEDKDGVPMPFEQSLKSI